MTLAEMADFITTKLGKTDTASISLCKGYIRKRYEMIYNAEQWRDTLGIVSFNATSNLLIVPYPIEYIVAARWNDRQIMPVDEGTLFQIDPNVFERVGTPTRYSDLTPVGVATLPSSEVVKAVSTSVSDTAVKILIRGELAGVEKTETLTLNGTTNVIGTNTFDIIYTLSKDTSIGTVTVNGNVSNNTLVTLWDVEHERKYPRIRLHEQPTDMTKTILAMGKRKIRQLTDDRDTPMIRSIDNALIAFATADMLERERQYSKAQLKIQEASGIMESLRGLHTYQTGNITQIIPTTSGEYTRDDWDLSATI